MNQRNINQVLANFPNPVLGVSMQAFKRIGPDKIFPNFKIACLIYADEIEVIKKSGTEVFCLEEYPEKTLTRNKNITTIFRNKFARSFLGQKTTLSEKPIIILQKSNRFIEKIAQKNDWILAVNDFDLFGKLCQKTFFRKILKKLNISKIPGEIMKIKSLNYKRLRRKYKRGFVIQEPKGESGTGTFFIYSQRDFDKVIEKLQGSLSSDSHVVVTSFIKGFYPSITACVTKRGSLQLPPQIQLIDIKELFPAHKGNGVFCGHDWSAAKKIKKKSVQKMRKIVEKVGEFLQKEGFKGIFGIDFLVDERTGATYPVELNPRLVGTLPTSTLLQEKHREIPLIAFHVLEFANASYDFNIEEMNNSFNNEKEGAHFFIISPYKAYKITGHIKAGVYRIRSRRLEFLRDGYDLVSLKNKEEFVLTDGIPLGEKIIKRGGPLKILRVITASQISQNMGRQLNSFGKEIASCVYRALKIESM